MPRTVEITSRAQRDISREVGWFVRHRSSEYADRWQTGLETRLNRLADDADTHPDAEEAAELGFALREAIFRRGKTHFRILFVIVDQTVRVLRIRNAAQDRLTDADI